MAQPLGTLLRAGLVAMVMGSLGCGLFLGLEDPKDRGTGGTGGNGGSISSSASSGSGGAGGGCVDPAKDCPPPQTKCVTAVCNGSACGTSNAAAGTACGDSNEKVCDGAGQCVACVDSMDCPVPDNECVVATCNGGVCGQMNAADLMPTAGGQIDGDCKQQVCDGAGMTKIVDDDQDPGDDGKECTADACQGGSSIAPPVAAGVACSIGKCGSGTKLGVCVECLGDADCTIPGRTHCDTNNDNFVCVSTDCGDGVENGNETGLDCGGPDCGDCANGEGCDTGNDCVSGYCGAGNICMACTGDANCPLAKYCNAGVCTPDNMNGSPCSSAEQCTSGFCADGFCCDSNCVGACRACSAAKKGQGADGTCGFIAVGIDPDGECDDDGSNTCNKTGSCSGSGACQKYPNGTQCAAASCAGNSAVGPSLCDGMGTCIPGSPFNCSPYACIGGMCPVMCSQDNQCAAGFYCLGSNCVAKKADGTACAMNNECTSGNCVDGFCCNSACNGPCQACSTAKKSQGANGTCGPILAGNDPDNECAPTAASTCGTTGACDGLGVGACQLWPGGTPCSAQSCTNGFQQGAGTCTGSGICQGGPGVSCMPYACNGAQTACLTMCTLDSDCSSNAYCGGGACQFKLNNGAMCSTNNQCTSDTCVDGFCCNSPCTGTCLACNVPNLSGFCTNIPLGGVDMNPACNGTNACNGMGVCAKINGQACAQNSECMSGFCIDNVCCNNMCNGLCQACSIAKKGGGQNGMCGPIAAGTDPDSECHNPTPNCGGGAFCL